MCICGPPLFFRFPYYQMGYSFLDSAFAPEIPAHTPGDAKEGNQNHGGAVPLSCQLLLLGEEEWFSAWAVSSY